MMEASDAQSRLRWAMFKRPLMLARCWYKPFEPSIRLKNTLKQNLRRALDASECQDQNAEPPQFKGSALAHLPKRILVFGQAVELGGHHYIWIDGLDMNNPVLRKIDLAGSDDSLEYIEQSVCYGELVDSISNYFLTNSSAVLAILRSHRDHLNLSVDTLQSVEDSFFEEISRGQSIDSELPSPTVVARAVEILRSDPLEAPSNAYQAALTWSELLLEMDRLSQARR
jgi:hypothetical protein